MCVLQYGQGKASFNMLAKIYDTWPSLVYRWVKEAAEQLPEPEIAEDTKEIEFDEMWHYTGQKKQTLAHQSSRPCHSSNDSMGDWKSQY